MKIEKTFYKTRESICVSHYPCLTRTVVGTEAYRNMELNKPNLLNNKNASIYIHIPFCDRICKFCPFNKFPKNESLVEQYLANVYREIDLYAKTPYINSTEFACIALGGGTPTCLSEEQLYDLIVYCREKLHFSREPEISLEGNPESSDFEKLQKVAEAGVNRISFGIQTFDTDLSKTLELHHSPEDGMLAIKNAHKAGIHNVGIDLMYNIPGQKPEQLKKDLEKAADLGVEHISLFAMNIPPKTKIGKEIREGKVLPLGNLEWEIGLYMLAEKTLASLGYEQYSVYDFAKPNKINLHAVNYFADQRELLGIGAAAFGYLNGYMYINHGMLSEYADTIEKGVTPILYGEKASEEDKLWGMFVKGFRMMRISKQNIKRLFGDRSCQALRDKLDALIEDGLVREDEDSFSLTSKGRIYGNDVCSYFIQEQFQKDGVIRHMLTKGVGPEAFQERKEQEK